MKSLTDKKGQMKAEEGSAEEEASESPAEEKKEQSSGKEDESSSGEEEGIHLPEEFQKEVHSIVEDQCDTQQKCQYVRDCISKKETELRKAEEKKANKGKKGPSEFNTDDAPSSVRY